MKRVITQATRGPAIVRIVPQTLTLHIGNTDPVRVKVMPLFQCAWCGKGCSGHLHVDGDRFCSADCHMALRKEVVSR